MVRNKLDHFLYLLVSLQLSKVSDLVELYEKCRWTLVQESDGSYSVTPIKDGPVYSSVDAWYRRMDTLIKWKFV